MSDKTQVLIPMSEAFKDAIGEYAQKENISMSAFIRQCVAEKLGYDLSKDASTLGRKRKYATDDERKEAQAAKRKSAANEKHEMLANYIRAERERDAGALRAWLAKFGQEKLMETVK